MKILCLQLLIIPVIIFSQNYNSPESIEYNSITGNYFISNSGNGQILKLDNNNLSIFVTGLNSGPYGLELVESYIGSKLTEQTLYACSGGRLYGYDQNGNQVLNYNLNGAFLNGITKRVINTSAGGTDLFITDFSAKKLYRYNIEENTHYEICSFPKSPNGVYYDHMNDRLIVVCWGSNAPIYEVNLANNTYSTIINTGLWNLDGITMDQCGNFYISAWSSDAVHKYNSDFTNSEIVIDGLSEPADIDYNEIDNIIAIPNSGNNTIDLIFSPCNNNFINEFERGKHLINTFDLFGRITNKCGFNLELYDDGSIKKKYKLKQ